MNKIKTYGQFVNESADYEKFPVLKNTVECAQIIADASNGKITIPEMKQQLLSHIDVHNDSHMEVIQKALDGVNDDGSVTDEHTFLISGSGSFFEFFTDLDHDSFEEQDEPGFDEAQQEAMEKIREIKQSARGGSLGELY